MCSTEKKKDKSIYGGLAIYQVFIISGTLKSSCPPSQVAQLVKNPPALQETRVWSLGGEDPLEKEMATHSSLLAGRIPWTEKPGGL